jgi:hypothetical protein
VLRSYDQIFQGAAEADMQLSLIGVRNLQPSGFIGKYGNLIARDVELPGLAVVAGGSKNCIVKQEGQLLL